MKIFESYVEDTKVMVPLLSLSYNYSDEDFFDKKLSEFFSQKDFGFIVDMTNDSFDWHLIYSEVKKNESMNLYQSKVNYLPNVSFFKECSIVKFDYFLPFNYIDIFQQSTRDLQVDKMIMNTNILGVETLETESSELNFGKFEMDLKFPFPLTTMRKYFFASTTWYDKEKETIYWINKPILDKKVQGKHPDEKIIYSNVITEKGGTKQHEKECYILYSYQLFIFQKINEKKTNLQQIHILCYNGWSNVPFLQKSLLIERSKEIRSFTYEVMENKMNEDDLKKQKGLGKLCMSLKLD